MSEDPINEILYQLCLEVTMQIMEYAKADDPIQAGGGRPFLLYLLSNYYQTWHDSTLEQNLSKAVKVKSIMTSLRCL